MSSAPSVVILNTAPIITAFKHNTRGLGLHELEIEDFAKKIINVLHDESEIESEIREFLHEMDVEYSNIYPYRDLQQLMNALQDMATAIAGHLISIGIYYPTTGVMFYRFKKLLHGGDIAVVFDESDAMGL